MRSPETSWMGLLLVLLVGTSAGGNPPTAAARATANGKPVAVISGPATVTEGTPTPVTLDGSGSTDPDNDPLTYQWRQTAGPAVTLSSTTHTKPTFPVPAVTADTLLTFELVVNDGTLDSEPAAFNVTVTHVNQPPTANAGEDQTVNAGDTVTLKGSASDPDGDALTYAWSVLNPPEGIVIELTGATTATPSFKAPSFTTGKQLTLTFVLIVSAGGQTSAPDTITITIQMPNRLPVGKAPANFEVKEGTAVTLDASESSDPDEDELTFLWTQIGGPVAKLTGSDTAKLSFTTPEVFTKTLMTFVLVVKDAGGAESAPVPVTVTILNVNKPPVAHPRKLPSEINPATITLDATTSTDPDGDALTYQWEQVVGSQVTLSSATGPTVTFEVPKTAFAVQFQFKLTVKDTSGASSSDVVDVLVLAETENTSGCSSTAASPGSLLALSLLAGALLSRRRRLFHR
ncbi:PKD domain-containing protein [Stigmatella aurantiaca]|nr:PKD domain-containing protein [Stigmatella aurantiaca]